MNDAQLQQYDTFLDENDWDIYYWATQEPSPTSRETAEGAGPDAATPTARGQDPNEGQWRDSGSASSSQSDEWAQTVGRSKPAYRPVPQRWAHSEILALLRKHVQARSAAAHGEHAGQGLGRMPEVHPA